MVPKLSVESLRLLVWKLTAQKRTYNIVSIFHFLAHAFRYGLSRYLLAEAETIQVKSLDIKRSNFWLSTIKRCYNSGELRHAIILFRKIGDDLDSLVPDAFIITDLLKACGQLKDVQRGSELHEYIVKKSLLETDVLIGGALIDMYVKCAELSNAQQVLDMLPVRDVASWTALIAGYSHNQGRIALNCFSQMQLEGVSPNAITFVCILKACGSIGNIIEGRKVHSDIEIIGIFESNQFVGNALIDMYAKCGDIVTAQAIFKMLPTRDVVSWNSMIGAYTEHDLCRDAIDHFKQMEEVGVCPNRITFSHVLKSCGSLGESDEGQETHMIIEMMGLLEQNPFLSTALVEMYGKCGMLQEAQLLFNKALDHDVVIWNALIGGYTESYHEREALDAFNKMQFHCVQANATTFLYCLRACANIAAIAEVRELHANIARNGLLESGEFPACVLIETYSKCGVLEYAKQTFEELLDCDVHSWNAIIAGFVEHGYGDKALERHNMMLSENISPNYVTVVLTMKACGIIQAIDEGIALHAEVARNVNVEGNSVLASATMEMYAKCALMGRARELFDKVQVRDLVSWTTLVAGYVQHGCHMEAIDCYNEMKLKGISLDAITYTCALKACGNTAYIEKGKEIHGDILIKDLFNKDQFLSNTLVSMYANCGFLEEAWHVFRNIECPNTGSWNALIAGYLKHEYNEEALNCFTQMRLGGMHPDNVTSACVLKACGNLGAIDLGKKIHSEIGETSFTETYLIVGTSLVDMYCKCGLLAEAQDVFEKLHSQDLVSWNSITAGYAQLGQVENTSLMFDRMKEEGITPNSGTLLGLLCACSHAGAVEEGQYYFKVISEEYNIVPVIEHFSCIVDLLCRAGQLEKAFRMVEELPLHPNIVTWQTIMGGCRKWGDVELGKFMFRQILHFNEYMASAYICMESMYIDA